MTFRFFEQPRSRSQTFLPPSAELVYTASGTTDDAYVMSYALLATPAMYLGLWRQDIRLEPVASSLYTVVVPYGPNNVVMGEFRLAFDTTGGTIHILASRQTLSSYPAGAPDYKGLIGVHAADVDGCDIVIPALRLTVNFQHPLGIMTLPRIKQLARNVGKVNSATWLTFAAGEVLFLGVTGDEGTAAPTNVAYSFACSENVTGLTVGAIANIVKRGHDYLWLYYQDGVDGGKPIKKAKYAYVERVYAETNFTALLGFG